MQLVLTFDPAWRVLDAPQGRRVAVGPDVVVTFGPLELASERSLLAQDIPAGAAVRIGRNDDRETRDGWPLRIVDAELIAGEAVIEARCYALFRFLGYTAVAIARGADLAQRRDALVAVFEQGRPDWRGTPICLTDAFAFDATRLLRT